VPSQGMFCCSVVAGLAGLGLRGNYQAIKQCPMALPPYWLEIVIVRPGEKRGIRELGYGKP
jgi:hypothetical protein